MRSFSLVLTTTPTLVSQGGTRGLPRSILVQVPTGGSTIYVGGSDVSPVNGLSITAEGMLAVDLVADAIHMVVASGTQEIRVLEMN